MSEEFDYYVELEFELSDEDNAAEVDVTDGDSTYTLRPGDVVKFKFRDIESVIAMANALEFILNDYADGLDG